MSDGASAGRVVWDEGGATCSAQWRSLAGLPPPRRVVVADDRISADQAFRLASEGTALLWRGDFHNARQLLEALARRVDARLNAKPAKAPPAPPGAALAPDVFHRYRMAQAQRARTLGMLLMPFEAGHVIPLRRAPDVAVACGEAHGAATEPYVGSLRELQGVIGAHEWRVKGVEIPELGSRIHPHYGMFSPVRGEYLSLVARAPLGEVETAFDIGTGTGVIAAILAKRGVKRVIATDNNPRALACARENIDRLGLSDRVEVVEADLFPPGKADLVVCNPPWLPGKPATLLETAIYDRDSSMLVGFLNGLREHLETGGEGWLVLSDLAERLGLRPPDWLEQQVGRDGLGVVERMRTRAKRKSVTGTWADVESARRTEIVSLWRVASRPEG